MNRRVYFQEREESTVYKNKTIITLSDLSSDEVSKLCPSLEKSTLRTVAKCALKTVLSPFLKKKERKENECKGHFYSRSIFIYTSFDRDLFHSTLLPHLLK